MKYSVDQQLPRDLQEVIIYSELSGDLHRAHFKEKNKSFEIYGVKDGIIKVTHWIELPIESESEDFELEQWFSDNYDNN